MSHNSIRVKYLLENKDNLDTLPETLERFSFAGWKDEYTNLSESPVPSPRK